MDKTLLKFNFLSTFYAVLSKSTKLILMILFLSVSSSVIAQRQKKNPETSTNNSIQSKKAINKDSLIVQKKSLRFKARPVKVLNRGESNSYKPRSITGKN